MSVHCYEIGFALDQWSALVDDRARARSTLERSASSLGASADKIALRPERQQLVLMLIGSPAHEAGQALAASVGGYLAGDYIDSPTTPKPSCGFCGEGHYTQQCPQLQINQL